MHYSELKRKKILQRGGKSKYVYLMENEIVKKAYSAKDPQQVKRFRKEVKLLQHLEDCPFVPKLLHVDSKKHLIYMSYTGKRLSDTPENRKRLAEQVRKLHLDWKLLRHRNGRPNYNIYIGNGTEKDGQVYVIDFGSPHYKIIK